MTTQLQVGRVADTERRRQRVAAAVEHAVRNGVAISVSGIARSAGVDRTFLYRHQDLLQLIHAAEREPGPTDPAADSAVTRASLQADLANAQARNNRLLARIRQLEKRLSQVLGEQVWREAGMGVAADLDDLQRTIARLEHENREATANLEDCRAELAAAREANRELTRALNQRG